MSRVLVNRLNVREGPSTNSRSLAHYETGDIIKSGNLLIANEGRIWLRYKGGSGNDRYVCAIDNDGSVFIDVPSNVPGPRQLGNTVPNSAPIPPTNNSDTGVPGIPRQRQFNDYRIQNWGCCFLCTCVKGGLTTKEQCEDCFNWGLQTNRIRSNDCYVSCNKEQWAKEIANKYGTTYHSDYIYQKNSHHFWLVQNGVEIFNSAGLGWRGKTD